jgi:hypothetical protein
MRLNSDKTRGHGDKASAGPATGVVCQPLNANNKVPRGSSNPVKKGKLVV